MIMSRWVKARVLLLACTAGCGADAPAGGPSDACLDQAPNAFRTRFVGSGFGELDGRAVTAVTTISTIGPDGVTCRAAGSAMIEGGGFVARTDNRRDDAVYPRLGAFIDADGDGACRAESDLVWTRLSIAPPPDVEDTIELTVEKFALLPEAEGCALLR